MRLQEALELCLAARPAPRVPHRGRHGSTESRPSRTATAPGRPPGRGLAGHAHDCWRSARGRRLSRAWPRRVAKLLRATALRCRWGAGACPGPIGPRADGSIGRTPARAPVVLMSDTFTRISSPRSATPPSGPRRRGARVTVAPGCCDAPSSPGAGGRGARAGSPGALAPRAHALAGRPIVVLEPSCWSMRTIPAPARPATRGRAGWPSAAVTSSGRARPRPAGAARRRGRRRGARALPRARPGRPRAGRAALAAIPA